MSTRFTIDGDEVLESKLAAWCDEVCAGVQKIVPSAQLEGLLLGGGYGRGEGGVLRTVGGDAPYNDLEFYVLIRGSTLLNERKYGHALHELGEAVTSRAGFEVELKILSAAKLRHSPASMFYYDLIVGHRLFAGNAEVLQGCEHHRDAAAIPLHEATRLLMNRCSGLLFALERLQRPEFTGDDADFVGRNLAKAQLAFGDVVLAAHGQYHWSCRERHQRLVQLQHPVPELADITRRHAEGVEFKLHPVRSVQTLAQLRERHAELTALGRELWLWLESRRLHQAFATPREYASSTVDKCPETSAWKNRLIHLRRFGFGTALSSRANRYPRQSLFHALNLLLWDGATDDPRVTETLKRELRTEATGLPDRVGAYADLWRTFN